LEAGSPEYKWLGYSSEGKRGETIGGKMGIYEGLLPVIIC